MKHFLTTLLLATLCATGYGQTLKSVMIDTNGVQVNQFGNGAQTNLSLKVGGTNSGFFSSISGLNVVRGGNIIWTAGASQINFVVPFAFTGTNAATNAGSSRASLGLPLPALTNTSNVTMMRALAGSTNTNQPFSGTIPINSGGDVFNVVVSNGIILNVTEP
jgi:hypothetical protein